MVTLKSVSDISGVTSENLEETVTNSLDSIVKKNLKKERKICRVREIISSG